MCFAKGLYYRNASLQFITLLCASSKLWQKRSAPAAWISEARIFEERHLTEAADCKRMMPCKLLRMKPAKLRILPQKLAARHIHMPIKTTGVKIVAANRNCILHIIY